MSSIVVAGDTSGSITLQAPAVAGSSVLTLPATSGTVMVNGPAFSAYLSVNQVITASVLTKLQFNTEIFDTNSNFDSTTNYRFTPTVAGYYQVNGLIVGSASTTLTSIYGVLYKNGAAINYGALLQGVSVGVSTCGTSISTLVYLNGSSDYIEIYGLLAGTGTMTITSGSSFTQFQAFLARSA